MEIKKFNMGKSSFVLPTVFDDALSYYEVLCKIIDTINDMQENLPIKPATETELGGILADPATSDDIVPVKIGEDNKLYTHFDIPEININNSEGEYSLVQATRKDDNVATGLCSCAFNRLNSSNADYSASFGFVNSNNSYAGFVEGSHNAIYGDSSHAEGKNCHVDPLSTEAEIIGAHAEGHGTWCTDAYTHSEGYNTVCHGIGSHIEGVSENQDQAALSWIDSDNIDDIITAWENSEYKFSLAKGIGAHVEGANGLGLGNHCHVEGNGCVATNNSAHAEGTGSRALGKYSHAGGLESIASGGRSFAHGDTCEASGDYSFAINRSTKANANYSFAGGRGTTITAQYGFGYGYNTKVEGQYGTTFGYSTISNPNTSAQFVCGKWNKRTSSGDNDLFVVGCGSSSTQENAFSAGVRSGTKYIMIGSTELTEANLTRLLALI